MWAFLHIHNYIHITEHLSDINAKGKLNIDTSMMKMYKYNRNKIIERTVSLKILFIILMGEKPQNK